jgi:hypothetical protein
LDLCILFHLLLAQLALYLLLLAQLAQLAQMVDKVVDKVDKVVYIEYRNLYRVDKDQMVYTEHLAQMDYNVDYTTYLITSYVFII